MTLSSYLNSHMLLSYIINEIQILRKKTTNWYRNPANVFLPIFTEVATNATSTQTTSSDHITTPDMINADVHAVATGVDQVVNTGRKGRTRKSNDGPRVAGPAVAKKKKIPKPPRNPFRRSETGKLQLKRLQMTKRVETMSPRVDVLRQRLSTMQERLDFVSGKLKLVVEELTSRTKFGEAVVHEDDVAEEDAGAVDASSSAVEDIDEDIELEYEIEAVTADTD
jgi:hypothetical protein